MGLYWLWQQLFVLLLEQSLLLTSVTRNHLVTVGTQKNVCDKSLQSLSNAKTDFGWIKQLKLNKVIQLNKFFIQNISNTLGRESAHESVLE